MLFLVCALMYFVCVYTVYISYIQLVVIYCNCRLTIELICREAALAFFAGGYLRRFAEVFAFVRLLFCSVFVVRRTKRP